MGRSPDKSPIAAAPMKSPPVAERLKELLFKQLSPEQGQWLESRMAVSLHPPSGRDLFLTYTLIGRRFPSTRVQIPGEGRDRLRDYLALHGASLDQLARIYLLAAALERDPYYFIPKVGTLIQVADTGELITFLRFLPALPHSEEFAATAVDALRTNISTVFDAIALQNPYPETHFDQGQWNQMYLKAAFMQRDLLKIIGVEHRANAALARIISDYAHERWAASRPVDPLIWRPVGPFLDEALLADMKRLLESPDQCEQMAGFLCCRVSKNPKAATLVAGHPVQAAYAAKPFDWKELNA